MRKALLQISLGMILISTKETPLHCCTRHLQFPCSLFGQFSRQAAIWRKSWSNKELPAVLYSAYRIYMSVNRRRYRSISVLYPSLQIIVFYRKLVHASRQLCIISTNKRRLQLNIKLRQDAGPSADPSVFNTEPCAEFCCSLHNMAGYSDAHWLPLAEVTSLRRNEAPRQHSTGKSSQLWG